MEKRKFKQGITADLIIGIVFSGIGSIFMIVGTIIFLNVEMDEKEMFLLIFGGIGFLFVVMGIVALFFRIRRDIRYKKLEKYGNYVLAEVMDTKYDFSVSINGAHPMYLECKYEDPYGKVHIFKSKGVMYDLKSVVDRKYVKVYVDSKAFKYYFVDLSEYEDRVIVH